MKVGHFEIAKRESGPRGWAGHVRWKDTEVHVRSHKSSIRGIDRQIVITFHNGEVPDVARP